MTTKLLGLILLLVVGLATPASSRLQVNQLSGFGAAERNSWILYNWVSRVRSNGGTLDNTSIQIARTLIAKMSGRSYWPKLKYLYPFLGSNFNAALAPLKYQGLNQTAVATAVNFVSGDWSFSTGLQGNGTTKYLNPSGSGGLITAASLGTGNNGGYGWIENNFNAGGSGQVTIGSYNSGGTERYILDLRSTIQGFSWGNDANAYYRTATGVNGNYYAQRSSATSRELYFNGVLAGTNTTSDSGSGSGDRTIYFFSVNRASPVYWAGRAAAIYMTDGTLTTQEVADLHSDLQTYLITPTGR